MRRASASIVSSLGNRPCNAWKWSTAVRARYHTASGSVVKVAGLGLEAMGGHLTLTRQSTTKKDRGFTSRQGSTSFLGIFFSRNI